MMTKTTFVFALCMFCDKFSLKYKPSLSDEAKPFIVLLINQTIRFLLHGYNKAVGLNALFCFNSFLPTIVVPGVVIK